MTRRFEQHVARPVRDLAGVWDFAFLEGAEADRWPRTPARFGDRMAVPGCFDATPAYAGRRGLGVYRRTLAISEPGHYRLYIDGLHHRGQVFLKGLRAAEHAGGFTRFAADLGRLEAGEHELLVSADNRLDAKRSPLHLDYFDWYHYGGISRGIELHRLRSPWIDSLRVDTLSAARRRVRLRIAWRADRPPGRAPLEVACDGAVVLSEPVALPGARGVIERVLTLRGARLWSPDAPNLHRLRVRLGDDDLAERIGLREVRTRGRALLINGKPVTLLGFNRHEGHPQFGHALPWPLLVADVQLLQDLGVNFVRGSHYPQDPRFLDLCDEAGICVWSEATGWQHTAGQLNDPRFIRAQKLNLEEMVAQSASHPSVILWGLLNESASHDPRARRGYKTLIGHLRALDPGRPVAYACNHPWDDRCLDLADVVGLNTYPGWYEGELETVPARLDKVLAHLASAPRSRGKPLIVSEIGAEGLYGFRDWNRQRWSEEYQARLHGIVIDHLFGGPRRRAAGLAIWMFNDIRAANNTHRALGRARGFNNKGVVDEYRRPKLAYAAVRERFRKLRGLDKKK